MKLGNDRARTQAWHQVGMQLIQLLPDPRTIPFSSPAARSINTYGNTQPVCVLFKLQNS